MQCTCPRTRPHDTHVTCQADLPAAVRGVRGGGGRAGEGAGAAVRAMYAGVCLLWVSCSAQAGHPCLLPSPSTRGATGWSEVTETHWAFTARRPGRVAPPRPLPCRGGGRVAYGMQAAPWMPMCMGMCTACSRPLPRLACMAPCKHGGRSKGGAASTGHSELRASAPFR